MRDEQYLNVNNTTIYIETLGEGYPLLIIHGGPGIDHHFFADYLDDLAENFKLIFIDLRGCGNSSPVKPETLTLDNNALDVYEITRKLGLKEFAFFGHSYGAFLGLQYGLDYPEGLSHLIIANGLLNMHEADKHQFAAFERFGLVDKDLWDKEYKTLTELSKRHNIGPVKYVRDQLPIKGYIKSNVNIMKFYYPTADTEFIVDNMFKVKDMKIDYHHQNITIKNDNDIDFRPHIKNIKVKTLIINSEFDYACDPDNSIYMHKEIKGSKLYTYKGLGHNAILERPDILKRLLEEFILEK